MIRLGYDTINYIVNNIKICPFATEQLRHRYATFTSRHYKRRPTCHPIRFKRETSLCSHSNSHADRMRTFVHTYNIDKQNIKPGHLVDPSKLADAIRLQTSSNTYVNTYVHTQHIHSIYKRRAKHLTI